MDSSHRDRCALRLAGLMDDGRSLRSRLEGDGAGQATLTTVRAWQQGCAEIINELSGGSKAHWLSRAFSEALLVRSSAGAAVEEVPPATIVERIVGVLDQAGQSLALVVQETNAPAGAVPEPHRFDFVHQATLRPVLEQAYVEGRTLLEQGRFAESLLTTCSVLDAILADALEFAGRDPHDRSFEARIGAAQQAGLVRAGCARLPPIARQYRELLDADGRLPGHVAVTARDARTTTQVLRIVMSDLDPGR